MDFFGSIVQFIGSTTFGVVLSLLIVFQWYKQHAKEQAIKNNLFAMRRKVVRGISESTLGSQQNRDLVDDIDSVLATLGCREPFQKKLNEILSLIGVRHKIEDNMSLDGLSIEIPETKLESVKEASKLVKSKFFLEKNKIKGQE